MGDPEDHRGDEKGRQRRLSVLPQFPDEDPAEEHFLEDGGGQCRHEGRTQHAAAGEGGAGGQVIDDVPQHEDQSGKSPQKTSAGPSPGEGLPEHEQQDHADKDPRKGCGRLRRKTGGGKNGGDQGRGGKGRDDEDDPEQNGMFDGKLCEASHA